MTVFFLSSAFFVNMIWFSPWPYQICQPSITNLQGETLKCPGSEWSSLLCLSWGVAPVPVRLHAAWPSFGGSRCSSSYCWDFLVGCRVPPAAGDCSTPAGPGTGSGSRTGRAESPVGSACWRSYPGKEERTVCSCQRRGSEPGCWWQPCAAETAPAAGRGWGERRRRSCSEQSHWPHCWRTRAGQGSSEESLRRRTRRRDSLGDLLNLNKTKNIFNLQLEEQPKDSIIYQHILLLIWIFSYTFLWHEEHQHLCFSYFDNFYFCNELLYSTRNDEYLQVL